MSDTAMRSETRAGLALWDFAVSLYGQDGVEEACLALQNRLGADVNMMIFCVWLAACGNGSANLAQFLGSALKLSRDWRHALVEPLRSCRQSLKEFAASAQDAHLDNAALLNLRDHVKTCELEAERLQILALANLVEMGVSEIVPSRDCAARQEAHSNLDVYFTATGVKLDPLGQADVQRILNAAFDQ